MLKSRIFLGVIVSSVINQFLTLPCVSQRERILREESIISSHIQPKSSASLAFRQSYGFFDDITDAHWKIAQHLHKRAFPNFFAASKLRKYANVASDRGKYKKLGRSSWWNGENFQQEFTCPHAQRIPSTSEADGPKWVCDPHRLKKKDCLIYSVGSNGNVDFERGIFEEIGPCEIHTFDMVTYNKRNGNFAKALEGYSTFHPWGIGTEEQAEAYRRTKKRKGD